VADEKNTTPERTNLQTKKQILKKKGKTLKDIKKNHKILREPTEKEKKSKTKNRKIDK